MHTVLQCNQFSYDICHVMPFHVLQFHTLQFGPPFSRSAFSCPVTWSVNFMSRNFMSGIFSQPASWWADTLSYLRRQHRSFLREQMDWFLNLFVYKNHITCWIHLSITVCKICHVDIWCCYCCLFVIYRGWTPKIRYYRNIDKWC